MYRNKRNKLKLLAPLIVLAFILLISAPARASFLDNFVNGVKNLLAGESKGLTVESKIELASNGDLNKNGQVDAGDTIEFSYTIINPTKNSYKFAILKTNIAGKEINSIGYVQGALSLNVDKDTISIPNLNIDPNQVRKISFRAHINFNKDSDQTIGTEAELVDDKNSSIFKAEKKEITAKKIGVEQFNKFVHITN